MGYHRAGFEVVGVDIKPQKHYPFEFHQADAFAFLEKHGHEFDVIHASPPCQAYSVSTADPGKHPDLVALMRAALQQRSKTYVIENVEGAPLHFPITLCGTQFFPSAGLKRHRLFESPWLILSPGGCTCRHEETAQVTGHLTANEQYAKRHRKPGFERAKKMMGIDWMNKEELVQAIPPVYTEWIGKQLLEAAP
jgi:DNA (cytosine-5)-methyltransferase 1